jgi:probable poly-beta-1,6-N-acetyl-D-glucosamine export protein
VGVHCRSSIKWPENSFVHEVLFYGLDFATILFVFISGFLFQHLCDERKFDYGDYLLKKLKHVVIPYFIVSIPALLDKLLIETDAVWMTPFYQDLSIPFKVLFMLVTGLHSGPFYFIPMICVIYLMAPLFAALQQSKYFNATAFVIVLIGMFTFNYGYWANVLEALIYFIPVYVFGMWAGKYRARVVDLNVYWLSALMVIYVVIFYLEMAEVVHTYRLKSYWEPTQYLFSQFNWAKLKMFCLAILLLNLFYRLRTYNFKMLVLLGNYSFGIYFINTYIINVTEMFTRHYQLSLKPSLFVFIIYLCGVMVVSILIIHITKKIFGTKSRLVIGS